MHDHVFHIRLDPHLISVHELPADNLSSPQTKYYEVIDHAEFMPAGLWSGSVKTRHEYTDVEGGVDHILRAPLGVEMTTRWRVIEGNVNDRDPVDEDGGAEAGLKLIEEVEIRCSRLLMGTVRSQCEANWKAIHAGLVQRLQSAKKSSG